MSILKPLANLVNKVEDADLRSQLSSALGTAQDSLGAFEADLKKSKEDLTATQQALEAKGTELAQATKDAEAAKADKAALEVKGKLADVTLATKGQINPTVLSKLISQEDLAKLEVSGESVKIDGKALKDYAKENPEWLPFLPALFPTSETQAPQAPQGNQPAPQEPALPQGGSKESKGKPDPVGKYLEASYKVPDFLKA